VRHQRFARQQRLHLVGYAVGHTLRTGATEKVLPPQGVYRSAPYSQSDMGDDDEAESGMYAVTKSGLTVGCGNFKAIDGGVLLFEDAKRNRVSGFVPSAELKYVLPADATTRAGESVWDAGAADAAGESGTEGKSASAPKSSDGGGFRSELTVLGGLGETYAERLHEEGVDSLSAMRGADAARVAAAAGVSESRASRWIDAANERDEGAQTEGQGDAEAAAEASTADDEAGDA
jgi:predicted flap endonuclease-1-like 5' DNA nuclease